MQAADTVSASSYLAFPTQDLLGGMGNDAFNNGPNVPIDGWYQVDLNLRIDQGATGGVFIGVDLQLFPPNRSGSLGTPQGCFWIAHDAGAGLIGNAVISALVKMTAGQYLFPHYVGTATTNCYGSTNWPYQHFSVRWVSPLS
jgi:hypothetical protein